MVVVFAMSTACGGSIAKPARSSVYVVWVTLLTMNDKDGFLVEILRLNEVVTGSSTNRIISEKRKEVRI